MTAAHFELPQDRTATAGLSTVRAVLPGLGIAVVLLAGCWAAGLLGRDAAWSAALGVALAAASAGAAAVLHGRMAVRREGPSAVAAGAGVTRALALGFLLKLAALAAGAAGMLLAGAKFPQLAAFAIAFAAAALLCQGASALGLARQLAAAAPGARGGAQPGRRPDGSPDDHR